MTDIKHFFFFFFLVKRAGRYFGFFKRAGRHEKGAGRRALQQKPRQNTAYPTSVGGGLGVKIGGTDGREGLVGGGEGGM